MDGGLATPRSALSNLRSCDGAARQESRAFSKRPFGEAEKISRLIFLCVSDHLSGLELTVLKNKDLRDQRELHGTTRPSCFLKKVPHFLLCVGKVSFIAVVAAMLAYSIWFSLVYSELRLQAWVRTFVFWAVIEVALSSTFISIWSNVIVPLCVYQRVVEKRNKVYGIISGRRGCIDVSDIDRGADRKENVREQFNAAAHFFVSVRLASQLPVMVGRAERTRQAVLSLNTAWPHGENPYLESECGGRNSSSSSSISSATTLSRIVQSCMRSLVKGCATWEILSQDLMAQGTLSVIWIGICLVCVYQPFVALLLCGAVVAIIIMALLTLFCGSIEWFSTKPSLSLSSPPDSTNSDVTVTERAVVDISEVDIQIDESTTTEGDEVDNALDWF